MKRIVTLGLGLCVAIAFTSCKSQETAYKKAYEKAKQQQTVEQQQPVAQTQVAVTPAQNVTTVTPTQTTTTTVSDANVRSESVQVVDGVGLKAYSVVCGSFSLKTNAQGLQKVLKGKGYNAQIVYNGKLYRVVASTYDDRSSAASSRNELRSAYPDAWLLYNK